MPIGYLRQTTESGMFGVHAALSGVIVTSLTVSSKSGPLTSILIQIRGALERSCQQPWIMIPSEALKGA